MTDEIKQPPLIHGAIIEIMRAVGHIAKSQHNDQQGFHYRGIDQVYNAVHPHFAEQGVFSTSTVLEMRHLEATKNNKPYLHAILKMRYTFWAKDGSHVETEVVGEGIDYSGDKASNKAMSVADKYAILQLLKIPTAAVDPDAPDRRENPEQSDSAPRTGTRKQRTDSGARQQQVMELSEEWKAMQRDLPDDAGRARGMFFAWVQKVTGRNFSPGQLQAWTDEDVAMCRAKL